MSRSGGFTRNPSLSRVKSQTTSVLVMIGEGHVWRHEPFAVLDCSAHARKNVLISCVMSVPSEVGLSREDFCPMKKRHRVSTLGKETRHLANGYAGKILEVDLSEDRTSEASIDESILRRYIGGRGLAARILWDLLGKKWGRINPLGPKNLLLVLTGPVTARAHRACQRFHTFLKVTHI